MMKKASFHPLFAVHPPLRKPDKEIITFLEEYLAKAKRGEIAGLCIAYVDGGEHIHSDYASGHADKNLMMTAVHLLHTHITKIWYDAVE
jgi:hypothetical protein